MRFFAVPLYPQPRLCQLIYLVLEGVGFFSLNR